MNKTIIGVFRTRDSAEQAIDELKGIGYDAKDLSIVMKDSTEAREISSSTGTNIASAAVTGATTGGVLGGITGLLIGLGAITVPGIGALMIGGPLAAALGLTGAAAATVSGAATGALAGGLLGALMGLGIPEEEARVYEDRIKEGAILLAVPVQAGYSDEVIEIMQDYDADQIRTIGGFKDEIEDRPMTDSSYLDGPSQYRSTGTLGGRAKRRARP